MPALRHGGCHALAGLAFAGWHCIDFGERSHNQVRQDLKSDGGARSAAVSFNRIFVNAARAEQTSRLGIDPAHPPKPSAPKVATADDPLRPRRGHVRQTWQNFQLNTFKDLHAPDRHLTAPELTTFYEDCRTKWRDMGDEEYHQWELVHTSEILTRTAAAAREAQARESVPAASAPKTGVWGARADKDPKAGHNLPVDPELVAAKHNSTSRASRRKAAFNDADFVIDEAPSRCSLVGPAEDGSVLIAGCYSKKVRCRMAIRAPLVQPLDELVAKFNRLIDTLDKANVTEHLVLFKGLVPPAALVGPIYDVNMVVLVLNCRWSPKVQIIAKCSPKPLLPMTEFPPIHEYPIVFRPVIKESHLVQNRLTLDLARSDDIFLRMVELGGSWHFYILEWKLVDGVDGLLDMLVDKLGAEWTCPVAVKAQPKPVVVPPELLSSANPFEVGAASATAPPMNATSAPDMPPPPAPAVEEVPHDIGLESDNDCEAPNAVDVAIDCVLEIMEE